MLCQPVYQNAWFSTCLYNVNHWLYNGLIRLIFLTHTDCTDLTNLTLTKILCALDFEHVVSTLLQSAYWEGAKVIDQESVDSQRKIKEDIHITRDHFWSRQGSKKVEGRKCSWKCNVVKWNFFCHTKNRCLHCNTKKHKCHQESIHLVLKYMRSLANVWTK